MRVVQPFALINRTNRTASQDLWIAHSGPIGVFDGSADYGVDYKDLGAGETSSPAGKIGWMGFTDIYWLAALVPAGRGQAKADFRSLGDDLFRADLIYSPIVRAGGPRSVASARSCLPGPRKATSSTRYEEAGIPKFGLAIDWGWFRWFEKPFLWLLNQLFHLVGNFGVAIILLTVIVRGAMFPIAQKQFASMAAMKAIQPKMKAIQEKYKDDKLKQQQEMQKLFKEEGVNPLAGCLPMLLQIADPVRALQGVRARRSKCATSLSSCGSRTCPRPIRRPCSTCSACCRSSRPASSRSACLPCCSASPCG